MNQRWRIYLWYKQGIGLVTFWVASAYSFEAAVEVAKERSLKRGKLQGILFKRLGDNRRIYDRSDYEECYGWQHDQGASDAFPQDDSDDEPQAEQIPLALPVGTVTEVWRHGGEKGRRRL